MVISVTAFTAARSQAIEDEAIIGGSVDIDGDLILEKFNGGTLNAGHVVGPTGPSGSGLIICTSGTRPAGSEGTQIWETDTNRIYVYSGTEWRWRYSANNENIFDLEVGVTGTVDVGDTADSFPPTMEISVDVPVWAKRIRGFALLGQATQVTDVGNSELELVLGTRVITHKRIRWSEQVPGADPAANFEKDIILAGKADCDDLAGGTELFRVKAERLSGTGALRLDDESVCYIKGEFFD